MNLASTNWVDQRWTQSGSRTDGEMEAFPYDPPGNVDIGESSWDAVGCRRRHQVCASGAGRDLTAALVALHSAGAIHRFSTWRKRVGTWALSGALRSRKPSAILMTESSVMQSGVGDELAVCSDATLPLEFGQDRAWRVCPLRRGRLPPARLTGRGFAASEIDGTLPPARPTLGLAAIGLKGSCRAPSRLRNP